MPLPNLSISKLFLPEPSRWGLRGDPHLWREMRESFKGVPCPIDESELALLILQKFELLTGSKLQGDDSIYVARHAHGGISSGWVHPEFWLKRGIPLLCSRYRRQQLKAEHLKAAGDKG